MAAGYPFTCEIEMDVEDNLIYTFNPKPDIFTNAATYVDAMLTTLNTVAEDCRDRVWVIAYIDNLRHPSGNYYTITEFINALIARQHEFNAITGGEFGVLQDNDSGELSALIFQEGVAARLVMVVTREQLLERFNAEDTNNDVFYANANFFQGTTGPLSWEIFDFDDPHVGSNVLATIPEDEEDEESVSSTPFSNNLTDSDLTDPNTAEFADPQ